MRYTEAVRTRELVRTARRRAGLSVSELARRAGTSRAAISAYEKGTKSPGANTLERILESAGFALTIEPTITFARVVGYRGAPITVPSRLPRNPGLGKVRLPTSVFWSGNRDLDLSNRDDRLIAYEAVMTNGTADDILTYLDRDGLLEIFDDMYLPPVTRAAWAPVVMAERSDHE